MRPNPLHDAVHFLTQPGWFTAVFWLLLLASVAIAALAWRRDPAQRTPRDLGIWGLRVLMGAMWWQQTLWKIPPNFDGLKYWMQQEADHAAIALQGTLVRDIVLPNLAVFGPLVYLVELTIGVSLLLGLFSRAGALLGLLMGAQPVARAVFRGQRVAVDLHVPGHDPGVVRHRSAGPCAGCRCAAASARRTRRAPPAPVLGELNGRCHEHRRRRALPSAGAGCLRGAGRGRHASISSLTCDTTLAPALRKVAAAYKARTGVRVFVFPTGPGLILPQLVRDIQNDIVVTQTSILDQAAQAGVIARRCRAQWRNPLVIAGLRGAAAIDRVSPPPIHRRRPTSMARRCWQRLDITPTRVLGAVDTDEVAFLLTTGAAQAGLLHMTDVRADARLAVIRPVPAEVQPPLLYAASVTRLARRPNPEGFVAFLATQGGRRDPHRRRAWRWRHDPDPRRAAASAVAPHPALGDGAVDPDHDRQRLAHLQRQSDLRLHLPRMGDAGRRRRGLAGAAWRSRRRHRDRLALRRDVDAGRRLYPVRALGLRHRPFPPRLPAGRSALPSMRDMVAALRFRLEHRLGEYNAVQKAAYWGVLAAVAVMILSGIAIWKPVQTYPLELLFGGFQGARVVHFLVMAGIVLFLVVHVALTLLVPRTLLAMVVGRATELRHAVTSEDAR